MVGNRECKRPGPEHCRSGSRFRTAISKVAEEQHTETYKGFPHGMPTTEADTVNADLLAFLKG